ncbi:MAG: host attachment protein [Verrucomicrobia bacterium]|nr:host attachment protein [Verrucomicrobiota bacterium]
MPLANLVIVADRGNVKAYTIQKSPNHGITAALADELSFSEAHQRYQDQLTDQAGAFPKGDSAGQGNAIAERQTMEMEKDARLFHRVGQAVSEIVARRQPLAWAFAAPAEINAQILQHVQPKLRESLHKNLKHDYVKTPVREIPKRFGFGE